MTGESHGEVVTGKLIFERDRSPVKRRLRVNLACDENLARVDCLNSEARGSKFEIDRTIHLGHARPFLSMLQLCQF